MRKRGTLAVLLAAWMVWGVWIQPLQAEDRRADRSKLVLMTFNAEFLWDGTAPEEGQADFDWKFSKTEAEEHMRRVAEVIIRSDPDIVNLVEVENLTSLTLFNEKFLSGRGYRPYLVEGKDTFTGQDVALLTRIDPEGEAISREDRKGRSGPVSKEVSKNYVAKLLVGEIKIALVGLHFLARPLASSRRLEREAQADAVRSVAMGLRGEGYQPVVLGDFNDYDGSEESRDHIDSFPITNVLRLIRALDPADPSDDLVNAASLLPKAERYTAHYDANDNDRLDPPLELTSIDHVLLAKELAAKTELVQISHEHDPLQVSDHFPVVVRLRLAPEGPAGGGVRVVRLLPNPPGDETEEEAATLKNTGSASVSLAGWKLRDLAGQTWTLDGAGTLEAGQEKTVKRGGQPMAMNNRGDTIELVDPEGKVVQTITYGKVQEGEEVTAGE